MQNAYKIQTVSDFMAEYNEKHKTPLQTAGMTALTPKEYAVKHCLSISTVQRMLKGGGIKNAEKVGGSWRIYESSGNIVSLDEYEKIKNENIELKALLDGISRMCMRKEQIQ